MKKLLLTVSLVAFAVAVQAGETKTSKTSTTSNDKSACCSQAKASEQTKACDESKASCCASTKVASKERSTKQALLSPKAAGEAKKL
jgi:hypothetical protein